MRIRCLLLSFGLPFKLPLVFFKSVTLPLQCLHIGLELLNHCFQLVKRLFPSILQLINLILLFGLLHRQLLLIVHLQLV